MNNHQYNYLHLDASEEASDLLDKQSFIFKHSLCSLPELSLESLQELVLRLPSDQVYASSSKVDVKTNLDNAHKEHAIQFSLEQAVYSLEDSDSFIMVRSPEVDVKLRDAFGHVTRDLEQYARSLGVKLTDSTLYLFLASPGGVTPYHIDRYSTFLFQLQGGKDVYTWTPWNRSVVNDQQMEEFYSRTHNEAPKIQPGFQEMATTNFINPGEALHIPFMAPHWVKNGDNVSASLSVIFKTRDTDILGEALCINNLLRRRIGITPHPVNCNAYRDRMKSLFYRGYLKASKLVG